MTSKRESLCYFQCDLPTTKERARERVQSERDGESVSLSESDHNIVQKKGEKASVLSAGNFNISVTFTSESDKCRYLYFTLIFLVAFSRLYQTVRSVIIHTSIVQENLKLTKRIKENNPISVIINKGKK